MPFGGFKLRKKEFAFGIQHVSYLSVQVRNMESANLTSLSSEKKYSLNMERTLGFH